MNTYLPNFFLVYSLMSIADYAVSNNCLGLNNSLEGMWKAAVMALYASRTEEDHVLRHSGQSVLQLRLEPNTSCL